MRRSSTFLLALTLCVLGAVATQAAIHAHGTARHPRTPVKNVRLHRLRAPRLLTPANGAHVQQVPTLRWSAVSGASEYEYEVSADPRFHSIVLGSGPGLGRSRTHNLAASLSQAVADGSYYWRVRGLTKGKRRGPWSSTRTLVKHWNADAELLGPSSGSAIAWPSTPLA